MDVFERIVAPIKRIKELEKQIDPVLQARHKLQEDINRTEQALKNIQEGGNSNEDSIGEISRQLHTLKVSIVSLEEEEKKIFREIYLQQRKQYCMW